jgi:hypothetical protein
MWGRRVEKPDEVEEAGRACLSVSGPALLDVVAERNELAMPPKVDRELGPHFKFICVENLEGFKAAALRPALAQTSADAEIIGVTTPTMSSIRNG